MPRSLSISMFSIVVASSDACYFHSWTHSTNSRATNIFFFFAFIRWKRREKNLHIKLSVDWSREQSWVSFIFYSVVFCSFGGQVIVYAVIFRLFCYSLCQIIAKALDANNAYIQIYDIQDNCSQIKSIFHVFNAERQWSEKSFMKKKIKKRKITTDAGSLGKVKLFS